MAADGRYAERRRPVDATELRTSFMRAGWPARNQVRWSQREQERIVSRFSSARRLISTVGAAQRMHGMGDRSSGTRESLGVSRP
jgi:hypothetical protein